MDNQVETVVEVTKTFATLEELCAAPPPEDVLIPRLGKYVKVRFWIPADRMAEIQRESLTVGGKKSDPRKLMALILKETMIEPRIKTEHELRAIMKADSSFVLGIVNRVVDTSTFEELKADLGEDW